LKEKIHTHSNAEGVERIIEEARRTKEGFFMANLVDFDVNFGHRQDPGGFAKALSEFDSSLPDLLGCLDEGDMLMVTADHGNDPTDQSTDHSREYVPILCSVKGGKKGIDLGTRTTFADAGKTVAEFFGVPNSLAGTSFLSMVK
jgi:phosphopentomutase